MRNIPVALQVYTIRDVASEDYAGTLEKVAKMGYKGLEIGGFGPYNSGEWNSLLESLNLEIISNHIPIETLEESFNHIAEFNLSIGNKHIICPYLREERRTDADDYKRVAEGLNKIGLKCKEKGMHLSYHNHGFEFINYNGKTGMDILFEDTDPELVKFELDTYWVTYGGEEVSQYMKKYAGRCEVLHLKDMANDEKKSFSEVGEGRLDFHTIMKTAVEIGVQNFVVEQDICKRPPLESVEISLKNIKKIKADIGMAE